MVNKLRASESGEDVKFLNTLLIVAIITTLAISPSAINAFNSIKLIVLLLLTTVTLGWIVLNRKKHPLRIDKSLIIISISFIVGLFLNTILGSMPVRHALVGLFARNNGALTYICLLILLILASTISHLRAAEKFLFSLSWLGTLLSIYGLMQDSGFDFIDYGDTTFPNPIFLTLGNTNFTSALIGMSLMATISTIFCRDSKVSNNLMVKILTLLAIAVQGMVLYRADATQGFIALITGIAIFMSLIPISLKLIWKGRILHLARKIIGLALMLVSCFGVFGIGPLALLFSSGARSLEDRYYHWIAGWYMFKNNILFGVGLDSYGNWYRSYRTSESIKFRETASGFTDDAHNVYVQIAATGGLFVVIPFVLLTLLVLVNSVKRIRSKNFSKEFLGVFSVWVVFQAQTLISINQTGLAVWGWIAGGLLINCDKWDCKGRQPEFNLEEKKKTNSMKVTIGAVHATLFYAVSLSMFTYCLFSLIPAHITEFQIKKVIVGYSQTFSEPSSSSKIYARDLSQQLLELAKKTKDPSLRYAIIGQLLIGGFAEEALEIAKLTAQQYPREFDAWDAIGFIYENTGRPELAIEARKIQFTLDPLNPILRERFAPQK